MTGHTLRPPVMLLFSVLSTATLIALLAVAFLPRTAQPQAASAPAAQAETTPTVAASSDPLNQLNIFSLIRVFDGAIVVKQDPINLDSDSTPELLMTVSTPMTSTTAFTETFGYSTDPAQDSSVLMVVRFDKPNQEWTEQWRSPDISGHASVLPSPVQGNETLLPLWQGKTILRDNRPIFMLRTLGAIDPATGSPQVQLRLWAWTGSAAEPIKIAGNSDPTPAFTGKSDVQPVDLDGDGIYEIVADSGATSTIWRWDGSQYVQQNGGAN